jgi:hypothetical protein
MNKMQEWLARAAGDLGVRIVVGYTAQLSGQKHITAQALFPDFGNRLGTLVFCSDQIISRSDERELVNKGYAISAFSEPLPNEKFDLDSYREMLSDWGWTSNGTRPKWLV